jgi:HSP20 family protein
MSTPDLPRVISFSEFDPSEEDFNAGLDSFFSSQRPLFSLSEKIWNPPTDVYDMGGNVYVKIEIAGVSEEDLEIAVDKNLLRVRGRRREQVSGQGATYHLMEVRYGTFERVFGLPSKLDLDNIVANYRDGFLVIEIPKIATKPKEIHIEVE